MLERICDLQNSVSCNCYVHHAAACIAAHLHNNNRRCKTLKIVDVKHSSLGCSGPQSQPASCTHCTKKPLEPDNFHPAEQDPKWPSLFSHLALAPGNTSLPQGMFKPTSEGRALLGCSGKVPCCYENYRKQANNFGGTLRI